MNATDLPPAEVAVSLIIPTYRRERLLVDTLRCALAQDCEDYEIIVVDQTPEHEPATHDFLQAHADRIRLLTLSKPSVTAARNEGLRRARGAVCVFVDDDTHFEPDFLDQHRAAYGPGIGAVQGRITEPGSREHAQPIWLNRRIRFRGGDNCAHDGKTNNLTGCNFSVLRTVAAQVGGFDERYSGVAIREETDFALRIVAAGYEIVFRAAASVFHYRSGSGGHGAGDDAIFFNELYYFNEMLFAHKHFSPWAVRLYRLRLRLRGRRALRHLIRRAEAMAQEARRVH